MSVCLETILKENKNVFRKEAQITFLLYNLINWELTVFNRVDIDVVLNKLNIAAWWPIGGTSHNPIFIARADQDVKQVFFCSRCMYVLISDMLKSPLPIKVVPKMIDFGPVTLIFRSWLFFWSVCKNISSRICLKKKN